MNINKLTILAFCLLGVCAFAQSQQLEEKLMALKQNQGQWPATEDRNQQPAGAAGWPRRTLERTRRHKEEGRVPGIRAVDRRTGQAVHHAQS